MLLKNNSRWVLLCAVAVCIIFLPLMWARSRPEEVLKAQLFKQTREEQSIELRSGDAVAPGDELYMTVEVSRALHVYVISEDANRDRMVIYPCRAWGRSPRLKANERHRLPGSEGFWSVPVVTPRERLLVIASAYPVDLLDSAFVALEFPKPCAAPIGAEAGRWIDSVADSESDSFRLPWKILGRGAELWSSTIELNGVEGSWIEQ